jgi:hypothetical protein
LRLLVAAAEADPMAEVNDAIAGAFGELIGMVAAMAVVVLLIQVALHFVPRPVRPLAQIAGVGVAAVAFMAIIT